MYNIEETEALIWAQVNEYNARVATHRIVETYPGAYINEDAYIKAGLEAGNERAITRRRRE